MEQPKFTLQELNEFRNDLYLLTEERFHYYFTHLYGLTKEECRLGFTVFNRFPYRLQEDDYETITNLLPRVKEVMAMLTPVKMATLTINDDDYEKRKMKVIYRENGSKHEIVVNLCLTGDIITYAEMLKRGVEVITQLDWVESIREHREVGKEIDVYNGDIFMTEKGGQYDWEQCRTQYILCKEGIYRKLLYTEGKGYMRNGEPDYDKEDRCNSYLITGRDRWTKVGNAYLDCSFLVDNNNSKIKE